MALTQRLNCGAYATLRLTHCGAAQSRQGDGAWALTGTWRNEAEGTHGVFAARREQEQQPDAAGAAAAAGGGAA